MTSAKPGRFKPWLVPGLALIAGVLLGRGPVAGWISSARAETMMSPVERLIAEDEIRQKIALYGLLADGDGVGGAVKDLHGLAYQLMTPDVVTTLYRADGEPAKVYTGRDFVAGPPPAPGPAPIRAIAGRHYLVATYFDDVSPTTAHTRTTAVYFDATKNMLGDDCRKAGEDACGARNVRTVMWVYHMTWTKTPAGWLMSRNTLRDDN